ncbi:MAG: hypothetical protein J0I41_02415 [Filimonas sp.]|nr:hypothetical protein [Filimonas sp.]
METYDLPVTYKGKELSFPMRLGQFAHGYKLYITVDDTEVTVERDDQGDWRALISPEQLHTHKIEPGLISAIMESVQAVFE